MNKVKLFLKNVNVEISCVSNDYGDIGGLNIKFFPISHNSIYTTSGAFVVRKFPEFLQTTGINLDLSSSIDLSMSLNAAISTAMFYHRKQMFNGGEIDIISKSTLMPDHYLKINTTKHFFRKENLGVNKVSLSIFEDDEDFGKSELIQFHFSKKDVQILFKVITNLMNNVVKTKVLFVTADRIDSTTNEIIDQGLSIPFMKVDSSVVFDGIWLHGQELFNLMFVVDQLNYGLNIENNLDSLNGSYRQIRFENHNNIEYIVLNKKNSETENVDMTDSDGNNFYLRIPISSYLLTILSLFVSPKMLKHDYMKNNEFYEKTDKFSDLKNIDYHISTRESFMGLGYVNHKKHGEMLKFAMKVKPDAFFVEDEGGSRFDLMYSKNGENLIVLDTLELNMVNEQWRKLTEALSVAYTESYKEFGLDSYIRKFFVSKMENGRWFRYEFVISASAGNKAAAVFVINKYTVNGSEQKLISSFRQPMFKKYLYQFLSILLNLSEKFEKTDFIIQANKNEMMQYRYKSMKQVINLNKNEIVEYGFKKNGTSFEWGIFSNNNNMHSIVEDQDLALLNISSSFRLLRGFWLPFVGYKICIGPDKYLTDIYGEFLLDKKVGDGEFWASNIFYVTTEND